ncbi:hypothetical protein GSI_08635 [Ganoderma sinense ZZ0214-1]|uniref:Uncharacterized protein n=1 Tax=Ganoderma sinense ZZ0214-1 TaxID=1077348 RepID=A0A2G8S4D7_9APHY|nr:hypothetical protein GSI_08635 [Ganoderma sinense ZZ0214-1]
MRLLDTHTGQFVEKDPADEDTRYAILSHTWDQDGEQTYKQLKKIQKRHTPSSLTSLISRLSSIWSDTDLSPKIRDACAYARADGFRYIWIDSCCIDKSSSSELSEAINSMYAWYGRADICYAYLASVPADEDHSKDGSSFRTSRWFARGWTLQELLAPPHLVFLSHDWKLLGSKLALVELVHRTTNISPEALLEPQSLDKFSVAQRLSWAAKRKTTRVEDRAYALLGIFDINMPILYGEGERAFRRLQEEIMRRIPDQSLFAWLDLRHLVYPHSTSHAPPSDKGEDGRLWVLQETQPRHVQSLLAPSLDRFAHGGLVSAVPHEDVFQRLPGARLRLPAPDCAFTPLGIRTQVPVIPFARFLPRRPGVRNEPGPLPLAQWYLVVLGCEHAWYPGCLLGRVCCIAPSKAGVEFLYCGSVEVSPEKAPRNGWGRADTTEDMELFPLSAETLARCAEHIELRAVYICHPHRPRAALEGVRSRPHELVNLLLSEESRSALLRGGGYTARLELQGTDGGRPRTHRLTLSHARHTLTVECQHALEKEGRRLTVRAEVRIVRGETRVLGPGAQVQRMDAKTLVWTDEVPWAPMLWNSNGVSLDAGEGARVKVVIRLDFVVTNHYALHVNVRAE